MPDFRTLGTAPVKPFPWTRLLIWYDILACLAGILVAWSKGPALLLSIFFITGCASAILRLRT